MTVYGKSHDHVLVFYIKSHDHIHVPLVSYMKSHDYIWEVTWPYVCGLIHEVT